MSSLDSASVVSLDSSVSEAATASTTTSSPATRMRKQKKLGSIRKVVGRMLRPIRGCPIRRTNIIEQLLQNDDEFSLLKLDGRHTNLTFKKLLGAIEANTTVKNLQIHGGLVANLPQEEQHLLWRALGNLPNLEEAHFKYFSESPLHLDGLNCFLLRAKGIRKLSIYDSVLSSKDVEDGLVSLEQHTNLKTVFFSHLCISSDRVLDPILNSLMTAPKLSNVTIRIPRRRRNLVQTETLRSLLRSKTLKILELRRTILSDEQLIQLAEDLESSKLKEVTVQCDESLRESCCLAISKMLKVNVALTRLEVWGQAVEEEGFINIINSLHANATLKILHLSHDIQERGHLALTRLFEANRSLETLYMRSFGEPDMMTRTDYFLKLNSTKLRGLQLDVNMDRGEMVEKLEKHSNEINHLYFLLRGNPNAVTNLLWKEDSSIVTKHGTIAQNENFLGISPTT